MRVLLFAQLKDATGMVEREFEDSHGRQASMRTVPLARNPRSATRVSRRSAPSTRLARNGEYAAPANAICECR